MKMYVENIR